jgi:plastocyanin
MSKTRLQALSAFSLAALLAGCGGSSTSPSGGVTVIVKDGGTGGTSGATLTITSAGINPRSVGVAVGQTVTIVNNDTRSHEIASDPHPQHGSCPSIEAGIGTLAPGQSRVTHNFGNSGSCSYHDHLDDANQNLRGTITVQ